MKTLQHTLKLAMIAMVLVCTSCSKEDGPSEDDAATNEPTTHELLMSGRWYIQSTSGGGGSSECQRQSFMEFANETTLLNKTYYEDIDMNCLHSGLSSTNYLFDGENSIKIETMAGPPFTIDYISETTLVLRQTQGTDSFIINLSK